METKQETIMRTVVLGRNMNEELAFSLMKLGGGMLNVDSMKYYIFIAVFRSDEEIRKSSILSDEDKSITTSNFSPILISNSKYFGSNLSVIVNLSRLRNMKKLDLVFRLLMTIKWGLIEDLMSRYPNKENLKLNEDEKREILWAANFAASEMLFEFYRQTKDDFLSQLKKLAKKASKKKENQQYYTIKEKLYATNRVGK